MTKYLFVYYGGNAPASKAEADKVMANWMKWFGSMGKAVVDAGNPTQPGKKVSSKGLSAIGRNPVTGYTIVSADSMDKALAMAKGSPQLASDGQIAVYEIVPTM